MFGPLAATGLPILGRSLVEGGLLRALSGATIGCTPTNQKRQLHSSTVAASPGVDSVEGAVLAACSPIETLGATGFDPITLGTSVWEIVHATTGLPWWASIPITTLALRTALLPLTIKARAATVNFALIRQATAASHILWQRMEEEQRAARHAAAGDGSSGGGGGGGGGAPAGGAKQDKALTRNQLTKQYLKYMRRQHATPSMWWYSANALVQINVFLSMSAALRKMSAVAWPGLDCEGLAWFSDMTQPAVELGTWATPYGVPGLFLPLAVFGAYIRTLEYTSMADRPRGRAIMELMTFPMFIAALVVPHATVLYWMTNGVFGLGLQAAVGRPEVAAALGLPMVAVHARGEKQAAAKSEVERRQVEGIVDASEDQGFVRYLAADTMARGQYAASVAALKRLAALRPSDPAAWRQLGAAAGRLGRWEGSAEAHERAGNLLLARGAKGEGGRGAAAPAAAAAEAGAEFVAAAVARLNAASVQVGQGGGGGSDSGGAGAAEGAEGGQAPGAGGRLAHVGRALELLHRAEAEAGVSDSSLWYYVSLGRVATGQLQAAVDAAARSWELLRRQRGAGGGDEGGGGEAAAAAEEGAERLARPLAALCSKLSAQGGSTQQLVRAAELAAEVGAAVASAEGREVVAAALAKAAASCEGRSDGAEAHARLRELAESL